MRSGTLLQRGVAALSLSLLLAVPITSIVITNSAFASDAAATATSTPAIAAAATATSTPAPDAAATGSLPFTFNKNAYSVVDLPFIERPGSSSSKVPRVDSGVHDSHGVRMLRVNGVLYNYPGAAATYGLRNINTYRVTGDTFYLRRAEAQAQRLIDIHVQAAAGAVAAWYYPNRYARDRHDQKGELIEPPWYSAMAQGLALSLFSRLSEFTGLRKWRTAADHTLASFLRPGPCVGPYTVNVDPAGYYWLQEWPWPHMAPDNTLNGHCFSAFGLYDYYHLTGDPNALALLRGALTTVEHYFPAFRNPGWISHYCLDHQACNAKYHQIHVGLMLQIYTFTQDLKFARFADLLEGDYPRLAVSGSVRVGAGAYTAYRFVGNRVTGHKAFTVKKSRSVAVALRQRIRGRAIFFKAASGNLAGYWLKEVPGRVYLRGIVVSLIYTPARIVQLATGGTYTALSVAADGRVRARADVPAGTAVLVDRGAVVNGYHSVRLSDDALDGGALNGYWLKLGKGVTLR
jgi:hypothetical protein